MLTTFITGNPLKFAEISAVMPDIRQLDIDLPVIQEIDPRKIIEAKLETAMARSPLPVMVEDTSLYFDCMNGLPGPLIKWFLKSIGTQGLFELAERAGNFRATAKTVIGVAFEANTYEYFEGSVSGTIVSPRGTEIGWNSIFVPDGSQVSFGEMSDRERKAWSMRRIAAEKVREKINVPKIDSKR